ncbi:MAG: DUF6686 family protein [Mesonia sp.]
MILKVEMKDIDIIYKTKYGISFYWKTQQDKIQLVFRDMGFFLKEEEVKIFHKNVMEAVEQGCCSQCKTPKDSKSILLKTPSSKIELAVSKQELKEIHKFLSATLFHMEIKKYLALSAN